MTTQYEQFIAMLDESGQGYGLRHDHNDGNVAVQVEDMNGPESATSGHEAEFLFSEHTGKLLSISFYEAEFG